MTTTYDPGHPRYLDEGDLRQEMSRVFDLCHGCRLCFSLCPAFPSMFGMIDERDGDVASMTAAEQDRVVDECYQCKLCYNKCPYVPPHEWQLDFPRLMMRAHAVRKGSAKERIADQFLGRTDMIGRASSMAAPLVNRINKPGSAPRRLMEAGLGIAAERLLPPYARERFTTWFKRRPRGGPEGSQVQGPEGSQVKGPEGSQVQGNVSVFATCFVEYMDPSIGKDIVKVYERNRVECSVAPGTRCCGAPWLHNGDLKRFRRQANRNVRSLAAEVRAGREVIVAQPTCAYVIKKDYPITLGSPDAELVSEHTFDPAEYLMRLRSGEGTSLDTSFEGEVPEEVTYHLACHLQAQNIGYKSRDLLKLTGTKVNLVNKCSGIDGTWGYKAANYAEARAVAQPLKQEVERAGTGTVCGDCHLANGAIRQETGASTLHPMQIVARAYGIPEE